MANKNIFDASLEITKANVQSGVITGLEINGHDIPLAQDLEDNKEVTINVSAYTDPVVINPTSGKDGMKKATVTLASIPGSGTLYCWKGVEGPGSLDIDVYCYTSSETPSVNDKVIISQSETGHPAELNTDCKVLTVTEDGITIDHTETTGVEYERYSTGDIALN